MKTPKIKYQFSFSNFCNFDFRKFIITLIRGGGEGGGVWGEGCGREGRGTGKEDRGGRGEEEKGGGGRERGGTLPLSPSLLPPFGVIIFSIFNICHFIFQFSISVISIFHLQFPSFHFFNFQFLLFHGIS